MARRSSMTKWTEKSSSIKSAMGRADGWAWLEGRTERQILDYWHAAGYLEKAAQAVCPRAERGQWFDQSRVRLKEKRGGARKLLEQMKEAMEQRQPKGEARKALQASITYFENHLSKMNYARYQKEYLPIGSGVTEAACKTVIKQRLWLRNEMET